MNIFKLILRYVPRYWGYLLIYILLLALSAVFSVFGFAAIVPILQILFGVSDKAIQHTDISACASVSDVIDCWKNNILYYLQEQISINGEGYVLLLLVMFIIIASLLNNVTSYFAYYFRIPIRTGVSRDIRKDLYDKVVNMPVGYFSKENKGDFISRMTSDAEEVEYGVASAIDMLIENPVSIIVYLITLFGISWQLTSIAFSFLIICCLVVLFVGFYMKRIALKGQRLRGKMLSVFEETLEALRVIKIYGKEEDVRDDFNEINESTRKAFNRLNRHYSIAFPLTDFMATGIIALMLWFGGNRVLNGNGVLGASEFIYYLVIFHSIISPIRSMMKASFAIKKASASVERISKIINVQNPIMEVDAPIEISKVEYNSKKAPLIEFDHVAFQYQENCPILKDVCFSIQEGQVVGVIGQTGSGKTTIAELLSRFYDPISGKIMIKGIDAKLVKVSELRSMISYVNQEAVLFNDTIYNNILYGNKNATIQEVEFAAKIANIHDVIMKMPDGYQTVIGNHGSRLSGGQKQCISIARAVLKNAPILVLDEATSALDRESEMMVQTAISKLMVKKTIIVISHHIDVLKNADVILELKDGEMFICKH